MIVCAALTSQNDETKLFLQRLATSPLTPDSFMVCTPGEVSSPSIYFSDLPWFDFWERCLDIVQSLCLLPINAAWSDATQAMESSGGSDQPNKSSLMVRLAEQCLYVAPPTINDIAGVIEKYHNRAAIIPKSSFQALSNTHLGIEVVQGILFRSSNNSLTDDVLDSFVKMIIESNSRWILATLLKMQTPTVESFAQHVLDSACRLDDRKIVNLLLSNGVDANSCRQFMRSPLSLAIRNGSPSTVEILIKYGAEVNTPFEDYIRTALTLRTPCTMLKVLITQGAVVNNSPVPKHDRDRDGPYGTPLQLASRANDTGAVLLLLDSSCNVNHINFPTSLYDGIDKDQVFNKNSYAFSLSRTARISPLVHAVLNGNLAMINAFLRAGADINFVPDCDSVLQGTWVTKDYYAEWKFSGWRKHYTALQVAVSVNNMELVRFLLEAGASPNTLDNGDTALQIAAKCNNLQMIDLLFYYGANLLAPAYFLSGRTALQAAAENDNMELVELILVKTSLDLWQGTIDAPPALWGGRTAVQAAAENGYTSMVQKLLSLGADINGPIARRDGTTAFQAAVKSRNRALAALALAAGAITYTPACTTAAIAIAINQHDMAMFELVLHHGGPSQRGFPANERFNLCIMREDELINRAISLSMAFVDVNQRWQSDREDDPNAHTVTYDTALKLAIREGQMHAIRLLLLGGADTERALLNISRNVSLEMLTLLLQRGARTDISSDGCTPLGLLFEVIGSHELSSSNRSINRMIPQDEKFRQCVELLLDAGARVNCRSQYCYRCYTTALGHASELGCVELVQILLRAGADPNWLYSKEDSTALMRATDQFNEEIICFLLDAGADVSVTSGCPSVLQVAVWERNAPMVQELLRRGVDPDSASSAGFEAGVWETPLVMAINKGQDEILYMLLNSGANINAPAVDTFNALQAAANKTDTTNYVQLLLNRGANVNAPASEYRGRSALQAAADQGNIQHVQILLRHGADVNASPSEVYGVTALQAASISGHLEVAALLLAAGADINGEESRYGGRTALEGAAEHGRLDIVHLLLENDDEIEGFYDRCENAAIYAEEEGHMTIARKLREYRKD